MSAALLSSTVDSSDGLMQGWSKDETMSWIAELIMVFQHEENLIQRRILANDKWEQAKHFIIADMHETVKSMIEMAIEQTSC